MHYTLLYALLYAYYIRCTVAVNAAPQILCRRKLCNGRMPTERSSLCTVIAVVRTYYNTIDSRQAINLQYLGRYLPKPIKLDFPTFRAAHQLSDAVAVDKTIIWWGGGLLPTSIG